MTASKAIIEKEYQPHVIVSTAGPNPFTALTDRELEEYRREVERKQRGPGGGCARPAGPAWRRLCAWWRLRGAGNRPPQDRRAWAGSGLDVTQHVPPPHSFRPVPKHIKHAERALLGGTHQCTCQRRWERHATAAGQSVCVTDEEGRHLSGPSAAARTRPGPNRRDDVGERGQKRAKWRPWRCHRELRGAAGDAPPSG